MPRSNFPLITEMKFIFYCSSAIVSYSSSIFLLLSCCFFSISFKSSLFSLENRAACYLFSFAMTLTLKILLFLSYKEDISWLALMLRLFLEECSFRCTIFLSRTVAVMFSSSRIWSVSWSYFSSSRLGYNYCHLFFLWIIRNSLALQMREGVLLKMTGNLLRKV